MHGNPWWTRSPPRDPTLVVSTIKVHVGSIIRCQTIITNRYLLSLSFQWVLKSLRSLISFRWWFLMLHPPWTCWHCWASDSLELSTLDAGLETWPRPVYRQCGSNETCRTDTTDCFVCGITHSWGTVGCKKSNLFKVPLKRNFRMWDFCVVIKFQPYLETLQTFFSHMVSENCFFSRSKLAGWAQNWRPSWRG